MIKKLIKKIRKSENGTKISSFNFTIILLFLVLNALFIIANIYDGLYEFSFTFIKTHYIALIAILLIQSIVFFLTYREYTRNRMNWKIALVYFIILFVIGFQFISINFTLEYFLHKAIFSSGHYLFIFLHFILFGLLISKYDFPITMSLTEFYRNLIVHFHNNLGIYFSIAMIVGVLGFINQTFVYGLSLLFFFIILYPAKVILANIRR